MPKYPDLDFSYDDHVSIVHPSLDILPYLVYYDGKYLVVDDGKLSCYQINESKENMLVDVGGYPIEVKGKEVRIESLPEHIKEKITKEMI